MRKAELRMKEEEKYDGLYTICTNLEDDVKEILKINHRRWKIEESFSLMKSEFKSRPIYLSRDDRIRRRGINKVLCQIILICLKFIL